MLSIQKNKLSEYFVRIKKINLLRNYHLAKLISYKNTFLTSFVLHNLPQTEVFEWLKNI